MLGKKILKAISILIDIVFCWYALLHVVDGTANLLHYSILIGAVCALLFFIIEQRVQK